MTIDASDIIYVFSGGSDNADPDESLGGLSSSQLITSSRLFDNVTGAESGSGSTEYRCVYLKNTSTDSTLFNTEMYIAYTVAGDVTVELGFNFQFDKQTVIIYNANSVTSGNFTLVYTNDSSHDIIVDWDASLVTWINNFETAIQAISGLEDTSVLGSYSGDDLTFEIQFGGSYRYHNIVTLDSNDMISGLTTTISISKLVSGGPINSIADSIDVETTTPNNLIFYSNLINLGNLLPLDSVPIWIKRIVPIDPLPTENDGFTLKVKGDAFEELT